ncbi:MAG: tRNA (guanosine(37)-N1)-methyltransferase TrmD [Christensenellales bacterium]|jgi:tRNA (guanine37-N1)-methyltransferase
MRIDVLTLFPEMFAPVLDVSILGRARGKGILDIRLHNIRDYTLDKHNRADDYPFGGGAGLVMMPQPLFDCYDAVLAGRKLRGRSIYLSPRGKKLDHRLAKELARQQELILLCGHYEGVDQRVLDEYVDEEISIGDFVTTGGELPAMVLIDCVSRYIRGVLGDENSNRDESFENGLLEYPQYTRPYEFRGRMVPEVLISGHHANIEAWRKERSLEITAHNRPDLLEDGRGRKTP